MVIKRGSEIYYFRLSAPEGAKIEIHFDQFELLSCAEQELALLDPVQTQGPGQTELFCGRQKPVPYITHGNEVFMKYSSKTPLSSKGFLLKYRIAPGKGAKEATVQKGKKSAPGKKPRPGQPKARKPATTGRIMSRPAPKSGKIMAKPAGRGAAPKRPQPGRAKPATSGRIMAQPARPQLKMAQNAAKTSGTGSLRCTPSRVV
jgi:hypothetical protein